eukprot:90316-Pyramimonas_sp.AAC.2
MLTGHAEKVTVTRGVCKKAGHSELYRDLRNSRLGDMAYLPRQAVKLSQIVGPAAAELATLLPEEVDARPGKERRKKSTLPLRAGGL